MFQRPARLLSLSFITAALALSGCGGTEMEEAPEAHEHADHAEHEEEQDLGTSESAACGHCDNCVLFARCKTGDRLPYGLTYWSQKVAIINSNHAHPGCVAMIPTSHDYGHVAYVQKVDTAPNPNQITLAEANWSGNACTRRKGTKAGLNIRNFWCPAGAHTKNCSGPM